MSTSERPVLDSDPALSPAEQDGTPTQEPAGHRGEVPPSASSAAAVPAQPLAGGRDDEWGAAVDAWGATLGGALAGTPGPIPLAAVGADPTHPDAMASLSGGAFFSDPGEEPPPPLPLAELPDAGSDVWADPLSWLGWRERSASSRTAAPLATDPALAEMVAEERLIPPDAGEDPMATRARKVALGLTACRLAAHEGDRQGVRRFLDEVLELAPDTTAALRARLLGSELAAEREDASAELGLAWLKRLGAAPGEDGLYYRVLSSEWAFALAAEGVPGEAHALEQAAEAFPSGWARLLGRVEAACLDGHPERAADELIGSTNTAATRMRVAFELLGSRFHEVAGRARVAGEVRGRLRSRSAADGVEAIASLRDAARAEGVSAIAVLRALVPKLSRGPLVPAVARWLAGLQAHAADGEGARETLRAVASQGCVSPALIRDRFDLSVGGDVVGLRALAADAAAAWPELAGWPLALLLAATARFDRRLVDPRIAPTPAALEDDARALHSWLEEVLEEGKAKGPEDPVLSLVAERAAEAPGEVETRLKLFRSWAALDPSRAAPAWSAASSLSHEARRPEELTAALRPLVEDDQGHPGFWWLAEKDAAAGRYEEAAARFEAAAEAWRGSVLAPWLRERAAEWRAAKHPARALETLESLARAAEGAEGAGVRATWLRVLRAAADLLVAGGLRSGTFEAAADVEEQASIWARVSLTTGSFDAIEAALGARPADPQALALLMTSDRDVPERLADELAVAAHAVDGESAVILGLLAATWRALAGEYDRARAMIRDLVGQVGGHPAVDGFLRRAARSVPDPHLRARLLFFARGAEDDPESVEGEAAGPALELGEALMAIEEPAAERLLRRLAYGSAALEARLSFLRLKGSLADLGQLWTWDPRRGFPGRLATLAEKVPTASSEEAARLVLESTPFESHAGLRTRAWALLALPAAEVPDSLAALLAEADRERRLAFALRWRALGESREPATRALVLSAFAEVLGRSAAAAALWVEAGGLYEVLDRRAEAQKAYERAHQADAHAFCALTGLRRLAVAGGDLAQAAGWAEQEDLLLASPRARVSVLLSSARVASAAGRDEMALQLLKRAFSLAPEDSEVFTRLGDRLEALGRHQELADLLADRLMVTRNPFEVTSLRLRRAETLAGPLGDRLHARLELESVLQKEPDHARALVDLASLLEKDGSFAEAAELLVRRAVKERDPERLGALYLRLGDIYRERLGDERRALGAYLRVLQIDPRHRASLAAAAELQAVLDPRAALSLVERLLALGLEPEPERHWRIRLGQLQEQAQDFRQAAINLRRAWDQPPTNLTALRELARFLERVRDERGRRALWEEAQERLTTEALDPSASGSGLDAWRGLYEVAQHRQRALGARFAGQMAATAAAAEPHRSTGLPADLGAAFDGRGIVARLLRDPEAEDKLYRALAPAVSSGLRALLRSVAPHLAHEHRLDLRALGLAREERQPKGELREIVTAFAHEAGLSELEIFVKAGPHPTTVLPASPQALVMGAPVAHLGGMALKFVAARAAYLLATGHAFLLADEPGGAALFLAGLVRVFVPSFVHPALPELVTEQHAAALGRAVPKKKKADLVPFAWEAAGAFDIDAVRDGLRAVADAVGMLACGHLPSALAALVTEERGKADVASVRQVKDARALATFALSWELDDLWRGWG